MQEVIIAIATAIISTFGGCIVYLSRKQFKRYEELTESAEEHRSTKDLLVLKSLKALGELSIANSIAVKQGHCSHVDKAKDKFESVDKELNTFLIETTVKKVNEKER